MYKAEVFWFLTKSKRLPNIKVPPIDMAEILDNRPGLKSMKSKKKKCGFCWCFPA